MARVHLIINVFVTFVVIWQKVYALPTTAPPPPPSQNERLFDRACTGCAVAHGMGYNTFESDCTCFYICRLTTMRFKTMQDWISYKRCCPCGTSWSQKRLTCVQWRSKLSSCFPAANNDNNPCVSLTAGDKINRQNPDVIDGHLCSGFIECKAAGGSLVPFPVTMCCPDGQCFDADAGTCDAIHCSSGVCASLDDTDDCECDVPTEGPVANDCHFTAVSDDVTRFMGKQSMIPYDCAPGTCWDQQACTCVLTNNTGYGLGCRKYLDIDFDTDELVARDGGGFVIYSTSEDVNYTGGEAIFDGATNTYAYIDGTARTWLGNTAVFRLEFSLEDANTNTGNENQCLFGNCLQINTEDRQQSITVLVERVNDGTADGIEITLNYLDQPLSMTSSVVNEEEVSLGLDFELAVDTAYELWILYCGDEDRAGAAIYDADTGNLIGATEESDLTGTPYNLIMRDSGFVFGRCLFGQSFEGTMDLIEIWTCKPDDAEVEAAIDDIFGVNPIP